MLGIGSSAAAQDLSALGNVPAAVKATDTGSTAAIGAYLNPAPARSSAAPAAVRPAVATAVADGNGAISQAQPASSVTVKLASAMATEAAWLYKNGWPLYALVDRYSAGAQLDEQATCLATAVYFEARGESVEGQLAVARVVMNRAASGRYPPDWCSVVKQPWQFSFVNPHSGQFPQVDTGSAAWARAQGIARLAAANVVPSVEPDVLWYHATYVAPSWGRRLAMVQKIGLHLFYRA
jgi:spore germination cell wall hydrolase CwlJ-like protein